MCFKCGFFFCCCKKAVESDSEEEAKKVESGSEEEIIIVKDDSEEKVAENIKRFPYPSSLEEAQKMLGPNNGLTNGLYLIGDSGFIYCHNRNSRDFDNHKITSGPLDVKISENDSKKTIATKQGNARRDLYGQGKKNEKPDENTKPQEDENTKPKGWKLHISINRSLEDMGKAWEILQNICVKYNLQYLKTPFPENLDNLEEGKEFTLYIFKNKAIENWAPILKDIEMGLSQFEVSPGKKPADGCDKKIKHSNYLYYRNDDTESGKGESMRPTEINDMVKSGKITLKDKFNPFKYPIPTGFNVDLEQSHTNKIINIL